MEQEFVKRKSVKGTIWSFLDNFSTMFLSFIIGIVLARLLSPSDYGTVGVLSIFLAIANTFVDCGFGNAIIRKKDYTQEDTSTAFFFNAGVGIGVYLILFFIAPLVAIFFRMPILKVLLRVLGLIVFFNGLSIVQTSIFTSQLKIKTLMYVNVGTQIPMGIVGIYFAYRGYGVWTLVIQQLGSSVLKTILLWFLSSWRPSLTFNRDSFHYLFNFGWKLLGANLLGNFFNEIYGFVIGRLMGASDLGLYSKAKQLATKPSTVFNNVINRVVLPVLVETQGDKTKIRSVYSQLMQLVSFLVSPLYFLLIVIAKPLITIIWTTKWSGTILLFQIFCIGMIFAPIVQLNFSLLQLLNRTDLTLKLEFIKKPVLMVILLVSIPFGVRGVVIGASVYNIYSSIINMLPTKILLHYSYKSQLRDILKYVFVSILSCFITSIICWHIHDNWISLLVGSLVFIIIYMSLCIILKLPAYNKAVDLLPMKMQKYFPTNIKRSWY